MSLDTERDLRFWYVERIGHNGQSSASIDTIDTPLYTMPMLNRDRNLLFGVFAVQLKRIPASKIMNAASLWASEPEVELGVRLVELGAITDKDVHAIVTEPILPE